MQNREGQGVWAIDATKRQALASCLRMWKKALGSDVPTLAKVRAFRPLKGEEPFISLADASWQEVERWEIK